jgi:hypothetical protein
MRKLSSILIAFALGPVFCNQAFAEDASAPLAGEPTPATAEGSAAAEVSLDGASADAMGTTTEEAAPAEEESGDPPGWFRMDHDSYALQLWFGATHNVGGLAIATDIYVNSAYLAEFDIGPALSFGDLLLTPMAGVTFDWSQKRTINAVVPQLFTIYSGGDVYIENWIQMFIYSPFTQGSRDDLYTRLFALFKLVPDLAVGPQVEATLALSETGPHEKGLISLPVGGAVSLNYGTNNTLLLFLGYETEDFAKAQPNDRSLAGRFTFLRTW